MLASPLASAPVRGAADGLLRALDVRADLVAVPVRLDGCELSVALRVDDSEDARRRGLGAGAITSTGLLHGLWLLPRGVPVPAAALPAVKAQRLATAEGFAELTPEGFVRLYEPAGEVLAVAITGTSAARVIERAAMQPPVFRRMTLLTRRPRQLACHAASAREFGVGLAVVDCDGGVEVVVPAPAAVRGVPGVFRWWLAELAYRGVVQDRTQAVN